MRYSDGQARLSAWLDYFDQPKLVMVDDDARESLTLEIRSDGAWATLLGSGEDRIALSGNNVAMLDEDGRRPLEMGLSGGDEGDVPKLVMRDGDGRARLEVELLEVELPRSVAKVGEDHELPPAAFDSAPKLLMRDQHGARLLELDLFGNDETDSPRLSVLDGQENPRLEVGYGDTPRVAMKDSDGVTRLEVELVEVETSAGLDYVPRLKVLDEDQEIRFERIFPVD